MAVIYTGKCRICGDVFWSSWDECTLCPICEADQDAMADYNEEDHDDQSPP